MERKLSEFGKLLVLLVVWLHLALLHNMLQVLIICFTTGLSLNYQ